MNREIEFRAWCEGDHGSLKFDTPHMEYDVTIVDGKYADVESCWDIHGTCATVPLMQFTGLYDKNGVKIFEGDVIRDDNKIIREVIFETYLDTGSGFTTKPPTYVWWDKQCEVIGNIFENPELLEEK